MKRREIAMAVGAMIAALASIFGPSLVGADPLNPFQVIASTAIGMGTGWFFGAIVPPGKTIK